MHALFPPDPVPSSLTRLRCAYDLRGLAPDARCPECGLNVRHSDPAHATLRYAATGWLTSLSWGARIALVTLVLFLLLPSAAGAAYASVPRSLFPRVVAVLASVVTAFHALGVWLLTRPQARFAPPAGITRLAARLASFLPVICELTAFVPRRPAVLQFLRASTVLLWLLAATLLLLHLRMLALHGPHPVLARCCAAGVAAFSAAVALSLIDDALGLTPAAGLEIAGATGLLAGCAALVLSLLGCTVAFHRAARSSRRAGGLDDSP